MHRDELRQRVQPGLAQDFDAVWEEWSRETGDRRVRRFLDHLLEWGLIDDELHRDTAAGVHEVDVLTDEQPLVDDDVEPTREALPDVPVEAPTDHTSPVLGWIDDDTDSEAETIVGDAATLRAAMERKRSADERDESTVRFQTFDIDDIVEMETELQRPTTNHAALVESDEGSGDWEDAPTRLGIPRNTPVGAAPTSPWSHARTLEALLDDVVSASERGDEPPPRMRLLEAWLQACGLVAAAHDQGHGYPRLGVDAIELGTHGQIRLTAPPGPSAPEADREALGRVLVEVLTLRPADSFQRTVEGELDLSGADLPPGLAPGLLQVAARATRPAERPSYPSVRALADAVREQLSAAAPVSAEGPRPVALVAGAVALVAVTAAVAVAATLYVLDAL